MNKKDIIDFMIENGLDDVQEVKKNGDNFILKFKYIFDHLEIEGAEEFANDECEDSDETIWNEEFFIPYLNDMAMDNAKDIVEEISEEYDLNYDMLSYELTEEQYEHMDFLVVFYKDELDLSIDELILEI